MIDRWRKHTAAIEREFKNATARPAWWQRMWKQLNEYVTPREEPVARPVPPNPPSAIPLCPHTDARDTTLGATLKRKPKVGDATILGIPVQECPKCKMIVGVVR